MKEINWQVSNLELSKRLQELGIKQESYFRWFEKDGVHSKNEVISYGYEESWEDHWDKGISAFTVAELYKIYWDITKGYSIGAVKPEKLADTLAQEIINLLTLKEQEK